MRFDKLAYRISSSVFDIWHMGIKNHLHFSSKNFIMNVNYVYNNR